jgi:hypothetical protein
MREAAKFEHVSKRDLRRMSKRERRAYQREMAAAEERAEREDARPVRRLLSTNKYFGPTVVAETEEEAQAQEVAMAMVPTDVTSVTQKRVQTASADPEATVPSPSTQATQTAPQEKYVPLIAGPYKITAPLSLNPRPRFTSRVDWSPAVVGATEWP